MQIAAALDEIVAGERRGKTRRSVRRQHVIGTAEVVADAFTGRIAQEDAAGIAYLWQAFVCIGDHQLQMLRRDLVGDGDALIQITADHQRPIVGQALFDDRSARQTGALYLQLFLHLLGEGFLCRQQDAAGERIVFGL